MVQRPDHTDIHGEQRRYVFAGFIPRLFAYIIDSILIGLIGVIIGLSAGILMDLERAAILDVSYTASGLVTLLYVIPFWAMVGGTPGKIMLGMRIARADGSTGGIGFGRALLRLFGYFVSTIPCYLGFFWIIIDSNNEAWHDKISRTYVVNV